MSVVEGGGEEPVLAAPATTPTTPPAAQAGAPLAPDGTGPYAQVYIYPEKKKYSVWWWINNTIFTFPFYVEGVLRGE